MAQNTAKNPQSSSVFARSLARGEGPVALVGITIAATLILALAGSAWWVERSQQHALETLRTERINDAAAVLATGVQSILSAGEGNSAAEVSAARRLMMEAAARHGLTLCRVEFPDGSLLLDADPKQGVKSLPEHWPAARASAASTVPTAGTVDTPIDIAGRGPARLLVTAAAPLGSAVAWEVEAGVGVIGVAALASLLFTYRALRKRLRGLIAIREALAMASAPHASAESLLVTADFGPEAQAWNAILAQRETTAERTAVARVNQQMTRVQSGEGDLATACDALPTGMILVDEDCRIKYLNGAAAVFIGAKREDAIGRPLADFEVEAEVLAMASRAGKGQVRTRGIFESKRAPSDEPRIKAPSEQTEDRRGAKTFGGGVLRFTIRPVRRDDTGAVTIIVEDVTQQKAADEARNSFVAQATHELRTPLTSIKLYVEQLIEEQEAGKENPAERAKAINVISHEARRLERIVGDMLSVAEIEAGSLKMHVDDVRLGPLFDELRSEFEPQAAQKQMGLMFDLPPKWPVMKGDRDKLGLALHNLIGNAIKYTPAGGRVTVRAAVQGSGPTAQLVFEVIDTGIGIKDDESELIFEKFYRAKDKRIADITGSGLGLTLAREVVRMHGGDIKVQSQVDRGSTFTMTVPAVAA